MEKLAYGMSILTVMYLLLLVLTTKMLATDMGLGRQWAKALKRRMALFSKWKRDRDRDTVFE